jgi:alanyl-tRNA synthetase
MNQFVPYFLGTEAAPYDPPRAADTQKCIRAGGKHNDLEDVGYDTYHHTLFEMLGNWSFGDYFKGGDRPGLGNSSWNAGKCPRTASTRRSTRPKPGDPGRIRPGGLRHLGRDLPQGRARSRGPHRQRRREGQFLDDGRDRPLRSLLRNPRRSHAGRATPKAALVNNGDADRCIEIWNLVFIQFNAERRRHLPPLPAKHVDTGMGFERACSIIQGTKGSPISPKAEQLRDRRLPAHLRKLESSAGRPTRIDYPAIPGRAPRSPRHEGRHRLPRHRRSHPHAVLFASPTASCPATRPELRAAPHPAPRGALRPPIGLLRRQAVLRRLVETLVAEMGDVFPELKARQDAVRSTLEQEEASFNQTLDRGLRRFEDALPAI